MTPEKWDELLELLVHAVLACAGILILCLVAVELLS